MGVSAPGRLGTRAPFVTTPYVVAGSRFEAVVPEQCPYRRAGGACVVALDYCRLRKAGPPWGWVGVMRCSVHGRAFTAYPPGHVPYGQVQAVRLAPDGGPLAETKDGGGAHLLGAALDAGVAEPRLAVVDEAKGQKTFAAEGPVPDDDSKPKARLWPRLGEDGHSGPTRSTQARRIHRAAELLGLVAGQGLEPAAVASLTGLPCGALVEWKARLSAARGLLARAQVVAAACRELVSEPSLGLMDRLAALGYLAGLWGRPYRWQPDRGRLAALRASFWPRSSTGTRAPPST